MYCSCFGESGYSTLLRKCTEADPPLPGPSRRARQVCVGPSVAPEGLPRTRAPLCAQKSLHYQIPSIHMQMTHACQNAGRTHHACTSSSPPRPRDHPSAVPLLKKKPQTKVACSDLWTYIILILWKEGHNFNFNYS